MNEPHTEEDGEQVSTSSLTQRKTASRYRPALPVWITFFVEGLIRIGCTLSRGKPGTGKTTLALQFLLEGARRGEKGLYVTLSESASASCGWWRSVRACQLPSVEQPGPTRMFHIDPGVAPVRLAKTILREPMVSTRVFRAGRSSDMHNCAFCKNPLRPLTEWNVNDGRFYCSEFCADAGEIDWARLPEEQEMASTIGASS